MINCYLYFDDPIEMGRLIEVIREVSGDTKILKILSAMQFAKQDIKFDKHLLITNYKCHQQLESYYKTEFNFKKILILDDLKDLVEGDIVYANKRFSQEAITKIINELKKQIIKTYTFVPILLEKLNPQLKYPFDLFAKEEDETYTKVLAKDSSFSKEELKEYKEQGRDFVYLQNELYHDFNIVTKNHIKEINSQRTNYDKETAAELNAIESFHDYIIQLGFDRNIVNLTKSLHKELEEKYKDKLIQKLLQRFLRLEGSFLYKHSILTATIALSCSKHFTWMTFENKEKIYMGSILHDLGFKYEDNAIFESYTKTRIEKELNYDQRHDLLEHTIKFEMHLQKIDSIHPDVLRMIRDHHGVNEVDDAYPREVNPNDISLVFALFILSHEFSLRLDAISFEKKLIEKELESLCIRFTKGKYQKIIPMFMNVMKDIFEI